MRSGNEGKILDAAIENGKANLRISTMQNLAEQFDIRISEF